MKRKCPNCEGKTVSIFRLVLLDCNVRCKNCGILVGTHWLLNTLYFFVAFLVVLFGAFYLLNEFGLGVDMIFTIVIIWALVELVRVTIVPLESKESITV